MTARPTLDAESFQELLASAFVVQQRLMDVQFPCAIPTLRTLVATGNIDVNAAMQVIAGRARNLANANGAAIGLLKGDELVYLAGSGSAVTYVGRHMTATLSVSAKSELKGEILRVEDAETDAGIGGEICRQFEAKSLLILPIYHEQVIGGVLQVVFNEPHDFKDGEVCAYQSMAIVVGELMTPATKVEPKKSVALDLSTTAALDQTTPPMQSFPGNSVSPVNSYAIRQAGGGAIAESEKLLSSRARPVAGTITHRAKPVPMHIRFRKVVDRAAVVFIVFVTASWFAYSFRRPSQPPEQIGVPTELGSAKRVMSTPQNAPVPRKDAMKAARSTLRRVKVENSEIDYISEDVTVRHFTRKPLLRHPHLADNHVEYVSEDVTVRRFAPKLVVVPPKQPVDHGTAVTPR